MRQGDEGVVGDLLLSLILQQRVHQPLRPDDGFPKIIIITFFVYCVEMIQRHYRNELIVNIPVVNRDKTKD